MKIALLVVVLLALISLGPLVLIASLNTISEQSSMGWHIPHNVWTYLSCIGLFLTIKGATE